MTIDELHAVLNRLDLSPRKCGANQWMARCPLFERHTRNDRRRSLAVGIGRDGEIGLVFCQAGCSQPDVLAALCGEVERLSDFPPIPRQAPEPPAPLPTDQDLARYREALTPEVAEAVTRVKGWSYPTLQAFGVGYKDARLTLPVYELDTLVQFNEYSPTGKHPKMDCLKGRGRYLYHTLSPVLSDTSLWIDEGEPDALSAYELGLMAVGVPGVNNWRQEYAERFTGRSVRVCMDCDRAGREAAYRIFADLVPFASSLKVVDLEPLRDDGYDLTDFLMDARKRDELPEARAYLRWLTEH